MKRILIFSCVVFALIFASCKSTEQDTSNSLVDSPVEASDETENSDDGMLSQIEEADESDGALLSVEEARQRALDAGADEAYPDAFAALDAEFDALKTLDGVNNGLELAELKLRYEALEKAAKARALKKRIDEEDLAQNSPADYEKGENALQEFDSLLGDVLPNDKEISESLENDSEPVSDVKSAENVSSKTLAAKADEAYDAYYAVYFKSYKKFANEERSNALAQKKRADKVLAQVARKEEYKSCAQLIAKGDSQYSTSNPEGAYNSYKEATSSFKSLADDVEQKRAEAQKKIDEAKEQVREVENYALNADKYNPLEEKVEGIEDEETVLLDSDEFENPEKQIIEIDENIEGE